MSIQSTVEIPRFLAISRIAEIDELANQRDYYKIVMLSHEPDYDVKLFMEDSAAERTENDLSKFSNKMLEDIMDTPFYRFSMFENYNIHDI